MEALVDLPGGRLGHAGGRRQLREVGLPDGGDGPELAQQGPGPHGADALDGGQGGGNRRLFPQGVVVADGEAVDLVLDGRHQRERAAAGADGDFAAVLRDGAGAVAAVLDHAEQRHPQPRRVQQRLHGRHVTPAAVEQNQIRKAAEAGAGVLLFLIFRQAAREDLPHGGVVVLPRDGLDFEPAVRLPERPAVLEHDHAGDVLAAREVRDVVGLDVCRRLLQAQQARQLVQRGGLAPGAAHGLGKLLGRVAAAHLHQLRLLPPAGHGQAHPPARLFREPPGQQLRPLRRPVERDPRRNAPAQGVVPLEELLPRGLRLAGFAHKERLAVAEPAAREAEHLKAAAPAALRQGNHVLLRHRGGDHLLPLPQPADGGDAVADARRALELQLFGGLPHLLLQGAQARGAAAAQEVQRLAHRLGVLLLADFPAAGGAAPLDIVVQARALFADVLRKAPAARRQAENLQGLVHRLPDGPAAHVGADVLGAVVRGALGLRDARPRPPGHADVAVPLVVLEQDVVFGGVLLNQAALEHQRLELAVGQDVLEPLHVGDHLAHLRVVVLLGAEVLADPVLKRLRLADVDDLPRFVVHQVDAGMQRQAHGAAPELPDVPLVVGHGNLPLSPVNFPRRYQKSTASAVHAGNAKFILQNRTEPASRGCRPHRSHPSRPR